MNVGVDADQSAALGAIWSLFTASEKREEDPLSVMWRAYLNGKHRAQSGEKSSAGVGQHIYIGQYTDNTGLSYLNARYYNGAQGQFTSEDPVFWGQQNLQDPQCLIRIRIRKAILIVKEDPLGKLAIGFGYGTEGNSPGLFGGASNMWVLTIGTHPFEVEVGSLTSVEGGGTTAILGGSGSLQVMTSWNAENMQDLEGGGAVVGGSGKLALFLDLIWA